MCMKTKERTGTPQPEPFTPGLTKGMVREHAYHLYRDKLDRGALSLNDWVLAEKDLVATMEAEPVLSR
jgi:hypothetical protein